MTDQLLGWVGYAGVAFLAVTICLNRLRAALDALNRVIVSLTGVVISARVLLAALRPAAKPGRQVVREGKRRGRRSCSTTQT